MKYQLNVNFALLVFIKLLWDREEWIINYHLILGSFVKTEPEDYKFSSTYDQQFYGEMFTITLSYLCKISISWS